MFQPVNSAIDRYGRLFVLDYSDNTVKLFDTDLKTMLSSFGGTGSEVGKFNFNAKSYTFPDIILISGAENSTVVDTVVKEVDAENTEKSFMFYLPNTDIKLDTLQFSDGTEILTYTGTIDPITGRVEVEFTTAPTSDILATYTYYEEDNLIISDTFNHRIQIVDRSGNSVAVMGEWGSGTEALSEPCGMQLNQAGTELHVVDRGNNRVSVWKLSDKTHVANYGSLGHSETSGLYSPNDIVLGHATNDVMFVTDTGNNRVVSFELGDSWAESDPYVKKTLDDYVKYTVDPSTKLIGITTNTFPVLGIEFDGTSFFLTDLYRSTVAKFNTSWIEQTVTADFGVTTGKVKYPRGLFISGTNLYVADAGSEEIEVISLA